MKQLIVDDYLLIAATDRAASFAELDFAILRC